MASTTPACSFACRPEPANGKNPELLTLVMAWGNKKSREAEYLRTGQSAALRPGDLGAKDIYELDDADELEDEFDLPWSPRPAFEGPDGPNDSDDLD
jgi:hypothetical protein